MQSSCPDMNPMKNCCPEPTSQSIMDAGVLAVLRESQIFQTFFTAVSAFTGLRLALVSPDQWPPCRNPDGCKNPFCAFLLASGGNCEACCHSLQQGESIEPQTISCLGNLEETAVPVVLDGKIIGRLTIGPFLYEVSHHQKVRNLRQTLLKVPAIGKRVQTKYLRERVLSRTEYASLVRLLQVLATDLASHVILVGKGSTENPCVARAKEFVARNFSRPISLAEVARFANSNREYFCRLFKKSTGFTFSEYVRLIRVERAKALLRSSHSRITEIAHQTGFQSVSDFNRVFKTVTKMSPSAYKSRLASRT